MSKHRREHSKEYRPFRQYSITHAGVRGQSRTCDYKFIVQQPWTTCSCEYKINILHDNTWAVHVSWRLHNILIGCCCFRPLQMAVWFLVQLYNFQNGMPASSMPLYYYHMPLSDEMFNKLWFFKLVTACENVDAPETYK